MPSDDRERVERHLEGLRLLVADLRAAVVGDVRAGTFLLCAAFIDTLALAFGSSLPGEKTKKAGARWEGFVEWSFPAEEYAPLVSLYEGYRCLALHNFSASGVAFTHGHPEDHLAKRAGRVILDRDRFVDDVVAAFEKFEAEVERDDRLRARVLRHFDRYPPMGVVELPAEDERNRPTIASAATAVTEVTIRPPGARSYTAGR